MRVQGMVLVVNVTVWRRERLPKATWIPEDFPDGWGRLKGWVGVGDGKSRTKGTQVGSNGSAWIRLI